MVLMQLSWLELCFYVVVFVPTSDGPFAGSQIAHKVVDRSSMGMTNTGRLPTAMEGWFMWVVNHSINQIDGSIGLLRIVFGKIIRFLEVT